MKQPHVAHQPHVNSEVTSPRAHHLEDQPTSPRLDWREPHPELPAAAAGAEMGRWGSQWVAVYLSDLHGFWMFLGKRIRLRKVSCNVQWLSVIVMVQLWSNNACFPLHLSFFVISPGISVMAAAAQIPRASHVFQGLTSRRSSHFCHGYTQPLGCRSRFRAFFKPFWWFELGDLWRFPRSQLIAAKLC
jgi:hypothetical protein